MKIAYLTAGAAGMFCGSCLRDNTLVTHLRRQGHDALLVPTYTPITTDEVDASEKRVFLGGINVYLQDKFSLFRHTPRFLDRLLDSRWLLRLAGKQAGNTRYEDLAGLTLSLLNGANGHQKKEVHRLVDWLVELAPEVVHLSNSLICGVLPEISRRLPTAQVVVELQGDDIFLDAMPASARRGIIARIRHNTQGVAGFQATSAAYAGHMADYFGVDRGRITVVLPGIDPAAFKPRSGTRIGPPTVGYFARICPQKGFHRAVAAWLMLREKPQTRTVRLVTGGWLGGTDKAFFEAQLVKIRQAGHLEGFEYRDCPTHSAKEALFHAADVFTLPTEYREPKGLSVLEAWASGIPAVLPAHGSFPELTAVSGAAELVPPLDDTALAHALEQLLLNPAEAARLGGLGRKAVEISLNAERMARETANWYAGLVAMRP
ncbi:MAG: glycosyltransferase family 4 protein [Planctomycetota bacterium]|nr:glycosyltransferase family 4 protein [Planctomycetota bacterium]